MTTNSKKIVATLLCLCLLSAMCLAAGSAVLSPALYSIEKQIKLQKCGVVNTDVHFDAQDFDGVLCEKAEFIRIDSLPDDAFGSLRLGTAALSENQLIAREDFDRLVFSPAADALGNAQFNFSNATTRQSETQVLCTVYILDEVNLAPAVGAQSISTGESISAFKFLKAADPENDEMSFEVVSYPAHGTVNLAGDSSGYFCYTPKSGYTGTDSFEYVAYDCYGNKSKVAEVSVNVTETADIYYDDLQKHWANNSAVKISAQGLMNGTTDAETGAYLFNPDGDMSRGDFLAMALICAGRENSIDFVSQTGFADDDEIPVNIKSYVEYAKDSGIVQGYTLDDGTEVFDCASPITRAQAAVIVNRILSLPDADEDISAFNDGDAVPTWAGQAVANLTSCGIFHGTGYGEILPDSVVTRAETAEILCNMQEYITETFAPAQSTHKSRNLLNLFGLLD